MHQYFQKKNPFDLSGKIRHEVFDPADEEEESSEKKEYQNTAISEQVF